MTKAVAAVFVDPRSAARFWSRIDKNGPVPTLCPALGACWIWKRTPSGCLTFWLNGRTQGAHRVSFVLAGGAIGSMCVLQRCKNRLCVNPSHLYLDKGGDRDAVRRSMNARRSVRRGPEHPSWKGDAASTTTKRGRARRLYNLGPCERCGKAGTDRHHKDNDTGNNEPANIAVLCTRCHMAIDGRLDRFRALPRKPSQMRACKNCGAPERGRRVHRGRCHACAVYFSRCGIERSAALIQRCVDKVPVGALLTARGETLSISGWSRRVGISRASLCKRLAKGWTPEKAIFTPKQGAQGRQPPAMIAEHQERYAGVAASSGAEAGDVF